MDTFSLLTTTWLPVRYRDGTTGKLAPVGLTDEDVVDTAATRADLQGAVWQLLIGLLQCAVAPKNRSGQEDTWEKGLSVETLVAALAPLEAAFQFSPDVPSFMQDLDSLAGDQMSVVSLLPEVPGMQTTKFNKDHFIKRGVINSFCPHCAVPTLPSLQLDAPASGKGYRTGLRGGGPLTTLTELQEYEGGHLVPLWRKLWLNVLSQDAADMPLPIAYDESVFPWFAPTRTNEQTSAITTPEQVDKLQAYWGMSRRIRLDLAATRQGTCDIHTNESGGLLSQMVVENHGINYDGWRRPLAPYRLALKGDDGFFSVKPQPDGLIWRD